MLILSPTTTKTYFKQNEEQLITSGFEHHEFQMNLHLVQPSSVIGSGLRNDCNQID